MTKTQVVICPYCGETQPAANERCRACRGIFEPLSRQATHNAMGPWYIHDRTRPHQPGCSYETLAQLIERELVTRYSILRGPTTKQFWTVAKRVPGVAHLLGYCHACDARVDAADHGCPSCGVSFGAYLDRNYLGLPDVRPLPWEAPLVEAGAGGPGGPAGPAGPDRGLSWSASASGPRGLSSFAADEELLDRDGVSAPSDGNGASIAPSLAMAGASGVPGAPPGAAPVPSGDLLNSPAVRSMQRRLAKQQRSIRLLVVLVVALALLGAINVVIVATLGGSDEEAAVPGTRAVDLPAEVDSELSESADVEPRTEAPGPSVEAPVEPGPDAGREEPPTPAVDDEIQTAEALIASAEEEDRPLAERVSDYEAALEILRRRAGETADEAALAAIEARVRETEDAVERLRLREFFPGKSDDDGGGGGS